MRKHQGTLRFIATNPMQLRSDDDAADTTIYTFDGLNTISQQSTNGIEPGFIMSRDELLQFTA